MSARRPRHRSKSSASVMSPCTGGSIRFDGLELATMSAKAERSLRQRMQIVFQDPDAALNSRMTVFRAMAVSQVRGAAFSG